MLSESKGLSDVVGSLWSESSWSVLVGESGDIRFSLDENLKCDDGKVWTGDASSSGLSLSLT